MPRRVVAFLDEAADPADQDADPVRLRRGHRPQPLDRDGLGAKALAPVNDGEALRRRRQLQCPVERRVAAAENRHRLAAVTGLVEHPVLDVDPFVALHSGNAKRPRLKGAEPPCDNHRAGEKPRSAGRLQREGAIGLALQLYHHLAQMEIGFERAELLCETLDELMRAHDRERGDVVDRLLRVERGALPAYLRQRVHHVRVDSEQPQLEDLEQAARAGADDDHVGLDAHADQVLLELWRIEHRATAPEFRLRGSCHRAWCRRQCSRRVFRPATAFRSACGPRSYTGRTLGADPTPRSLEQACGTGRQRA